jgi:hypothetical protein
MNKVNKIMKKNFLMKAFVCLFTVVALCSCKKDDDEVPTSTVPGNTITATVESGSSFNNQIDTVIVRIDSYELTETKSAYSNGGFTLNLPATVIDTYLDEYDDAPTGITVSNPKVKVGWADLRAYKSGSIVGDIYYATGKSDSDWEGELVYVNGDVSVTGSYTEKDGDESYTEKSNVHLRKGWNIVYSKETENEKSYVYEQTTQAPAGLKWYYNSWYSSQDASVKKAPSLLRKSKIK